jgi:putative ABC transport system permease protein
MFRSHLIIALRNIWRNKTFSVINIAGLALGLAISITIWIWIRFELSYDGFHEHKEDIFLIEQTIQISDGEYKTSRCGSAYAPALESKFPEIRKSVRIGPSLELLLTTEDDMDSTTREQKKFIETRVLATDSTFFEVFSFPLVEGIPKTVLKDPYSIVITQHMAEKYFGYKSPMGKIIRINDSFNFTITGIARDVPENSSIQFDFLIPFWFMQEMGYDLNSYEGTNFTSFVLLNENADYKSLDAKIPGYLNSLHTSELNPHQFLTSLSRHHLYGEELNYIGVYLNTIVAIMILLIACINFINLSTARSLSRAREVGIKKVAGATRSQLVRQFLGESMVMTIIAVNLALLMVERILPFSDKLLQTRLSLQYNDIHFVIGIIILTAVTGLLAGTYPAFVLSSFKPAIILRSKLISGSRGGRSRKVLVIVQYTFSILFIICTLVMSRQYDHLMNADPGFNRENILYFRLRGNAHKTYELMKEDLIKNPSIRSVTTASEIPNNILRGDIEWGDKTRKKNVIARIMWCGFDFTTALGMKMKEGRFYSPDYALDSTDAIVVNEEAVKIMGWNNPVGQRFLLFDKEYTVIGVVDKISFFPFNIGGSALILPFGASNNYVYVKLHEGWSNKVIDDIRGIFENYNAAYPFEFNFLKDYKYDMLKYADVNKRIFIFFSFLGIFVSCLGLLGLAIYVAEQKRKEICIRKAFGSTHWQIGMLFISSFTNLVFLANLIAIPLSYLVMHSLLQFFTQRTALSWWIFALSALISLIFSILTVTSQLYKVTGTDPAKYLRYE